MAARKSAAPPKPTHLAASTRVVASHLYMRRVDIATAKKSVLEARSTSRLVSPVPKA
jgi:hypothetical protein